MFKRKKNNTVKAVMKQIIRCYYKYTYNEYDYFTLIPVI